MIRALSILPLLLSPACDCGSTATPPEAPSAVAALPSPPAVPFSAASFPCCASDRARMLVVGYTQLGDALAHDDLGVARVEVEEVARRAAVAAEDPALSAGGRALAARVAARVRGAPPERLEAVRTLFGEISELIIVLAQADRGGSMRVAVAFCPRTNANWLQVASEIENPYLGSLDASSGVFKP